MEAIIHDVFEGMIALAAVLSALLSWRNGKKVEAVAATVDQTKHEMNSMKDELVASVAKASHLEGRAEAAAEQTMAAKQGDV